MQQQLASPQTTQVLDTIRSYANDQAAVNGVVDNAKAMLDALNNSPQCDADPGCSDGRAKLHNSRPPVPAPPPRMCWPKWSS